MSALDMLQGAVLPLRDAGEPKRAAEVLVAIVDLTALVKAADRLATAAERRDYSTGCAITVMTARAELAEAARNARAALATVNGGAA